MRIIAVPYLWPPAPFKASWPRPCGRP